MAKQFRSVQIRIDRLDKKVSVIHVFFVAKPFPLGFRLPKPGRSISKFTGSLLTRFI